MTTRHAPARALDKRRHPAWLASLSRQVRQSLFDSVFGSADSASSEPAPALTIERAPTPIGPTRLALRHPGNAADRQAARALYERCLGHYRSVLRAEDAVLDVDDVGAAVAAFVAANFEALRGVRATPEMLRRLERQLRGVVRLSSGWDTASIDERQAYFEQMAILAVLIAESSMQAVTQGPAALANVKRAARAYLNELLGLDSNALTLGPEGLTPRAMGKAALATQAA
jgi:hypothetical protein